MENKYDDAVFWGEEITKFHRTLTGYIGTLLHHGFELTGIEEPMPDNKMLELIPEMKDELRRPMMLLISAIKK